MTRLTCKYGDHRGVSILILSGELDAAMYSLAEPYVRYLRHITPTRLVIDGTRLTYLSSAGLGVLAALIDEMQGEGTSVKIAVREPRVVNVLEIACDQLGMAHLLDLFPTVNQAIDSFDDR